MTTIATHAGTKIDAAAHLIYSRSDDNPTAVIYDRDEVIQTVAAITRRHQRDVAMEVSPRRAINGLVVVEGYRNAPSVTVIFPTVCRQCGVAWTDHPAGDGLGECPGDFDKTIDEMTDLVHGAAVALVRPASTPARTTTPNIWGGFDAHLSDGRLLRVCREDREGSVDVLVFNNASNLIVLAQMTVTTSALDGDGLGALVRTFADATAI